MKVGDEVRIKDGEKYRDWSNHYCGTVGTVHHVGHDYCEVVLFDGKIALFPHDYIEPYVKTPKINPKCSCGARHTSRPTFHEDWCDLLMKTLNDSSDMDDFVMDWSFGD